ncbi:UbiA-like polyprenyltransferase [Schlesneria sp. DSM 10557]|uniref:UbiA-like polyprenyltransferase n=1 Tax=Schlesneria sp. DSM 10557 TaxID=3044399 RepID=UPI0035A1701D
MLSQIRHLLELIRFSHTVFALPFALLSAALAWRMPDSPFSWVHLLGIVLCMIFARSAAMAFNRIVDRKFDAENPRTQKRHLPAGLLKLSTVVLFTLVSSAGFVASTLLFLPNPWPLRLSVPVLLFLMGYSYAKRFTVLCHYWLSAALMLSPLAAWIAIRGEVAVIPALLSAVIFFWVGGFDILYACQDADYDRERNLFSIPSRWGIRTALRIALISHLLTIASLFAVWHFGGLGMPFLVGIIAVSGLLLYEHSLVTPADLTRVNVAFFNVNAVVSLGLLAIGLADIWYNRLSAP